jgi:hypothetical protein
MDSWDSWSHYQQRDVTLDEERLYQHFRDCLRYESTYNVIERFRRLFIEASGYPDSQIWQSLLRLTNPERNPAIDREYKYILNRCCYTLINLWQLERRNHAAIPELIGLFEQLPSDLGYAPSTRHLRELMRSFLETEQYATLRRLPQVLFETDDPTVWQEDQLLGSLLQRYPYLYEYCLLTKDSDNQQKHNIHLLKDRTQKKFETDLARYDNYRTGRLRLEPIPNPTLLSDAELNEALDHYLDRVDKRNTHKKSAKRFSCDSKMIRSYRDFKEELNAYLIEPVTAVEPRYAAQFKRKLRKELQHWFADSDSQQVNDFLINETCRRLLNVLVIERRNAQHHTFIDLVGNIGYALTVGLLLRIVLFCRTVRPWLEQRFALLFDHYESSKRAEVGWLVTALEHINIALSTNFGGFSFRANSA